MDMSTAKFIAWFRRHLYAIFVISILALTIGTRFYQLGAVPPGFTWDEAAVAYNGYAVTTTRRDEWLKFIPISFQSFGDYKAPAMMYLTGPIIALFGFNPIVFRSIFALSGVVSVAAIMIIGRWIGAYIWSDDQHEHPDENFSERFSGAERMELLSGLFMALTPWHIHFSRVGFESGVALSLLLLGIISIWRWAQLRSLIEKFAWPDWIANTLPDIFDTDRLAWIWLAKGGLFWVAAMYVYHSPKLIVPLLGLLFAIVLFVRAGSLIWSYWKDILIAGSLSIAATAPLLYDTLYGPGDTRFTQSTLFGLDLSLSELLIAIGQRFTHHLSPAFLIGDWTTNIRHGFMEWGMILPSSFFLITSSLFLFIWLSSRGTTLKSVSSNLRNVLFLLIALIIIALLPASIGRELHHSNRALFSVPWLILSASVMFHAIYFWFQHPPFWADRFHAQLRRIMAKSWLGTGLIVHGLIASAFLHFYFTQYPALAGDAFQEGYFQAVAAVEEYRSSTEASESVMFTDYYGQPYIYVLLQREMNPIVYRQGGLADYMFSSIQVSDLERENTVIVASPEAELFGANADEVILGSDGQPQFLLFYPNQQ